MGMGVVDRKLIVLGLTAFLLGGGVAAFGPASLGMGAALDAGCASLDEDLEGVPAERSEGEVQASGDRAFRLVRWQIDQPSPLEGGALSACVNVGSIEIVPSDGDHVRLSATLGARGDDARQLVEQMDIEAKVAHGDGRIAVVVGQDGGVDGVDSFESARQMVQIRLEVPDDPTWDVHADGQVGEIETEDLRLGSFQARLGTGEIDVDGVTMYGPIDAQVETGEVDLTVTPDEHARYHVDIGTGEVDLDLPSGDQVGYDVTAATGSGDVDVDIGPTEERRGEDRGSGEEVHARSAGYADRPIRIEMELTAGLGDLDVTAR